MSLNIGPWLSELAETFREKPTRAPLYALYGPYLSAWYALTSRYPLGTNIYERDWDLLIVLDACRVDTLRELADEYEFISDVGSIWSVGSQSDEWMANTFTEAWRREVERTTLVTVNGHSNAILLDGNYPPKNHTVPVDWSRWDVVDGDDFDALHLLWQHYHSERLGVVPPRVVTDHVVDIYRNDDPDRLIAHYFQPHLPYIANAVRTDGEPTRMEREGYRMLERGEAAHSEVYDLYKDNLRLVLDEVELLLSNVDAERVVITADHGEAFGEGLAYGHPEGFLHPVVKRVPWVETTAADDGEYEPDIDAHEVGETDLESHLHDLGYL